MSVSIFTKRMRISIPKCSTRLLCFSVVFEATRPLCAWQKKRENLSRSMNGNGSEDKDDNVVCVVACCGGPNDATRYLHRLVSR
jgi:hypothetical protein